MTAKREYRSLLGEALAEGTTSHAHCVTVDSPRLTRPSNQHCCKSTCITSHKCLQVVLPLFFFPE